MLKIKLIALFNTLVMTSFLPQHAFDIIVSKEDLGRDDSSLARD